MFAHILSDDRLQQRILFGVSGLGAVFVIELGLALLRYTLS